MLIILGNQFHQVSYGCDKKMQILYQWSIFECEPFFDSDFKCIYLLKCISILPWTTLPPWPTTHHVSSSLFCACVSRKVQTKLFAIISLSWEHETQSTVHSLWVHSTYTSPLEKYDITRLFLLYHILLKNSSKLKHQYDCTVRACQIYSCYN